MSGPGADDAGGELAGADDGDLAGLGAGAIGSLLERHGLAPSRALGQNFLIDPNTARRLASAAGAVAGARVFEIGPGLGSLTVALAGRGARVTAVEVDRHLLPALAEVVAGLAPAPTIVHADALDVDLEALLAGSPTWRLAANLPYNVGTTIFLRVLAEAPMVTGGMVLVQREVADRLAASAGDPAYGIPSVKAAWWAMCRVGGRVPATVFHPRPRVDSAFVTFERRAEPGPPARRQRVFALVDQAFGQRRKMLRRSLAGVLAESDFDRAGVEPTARPEELDLTDWIALAGPEIDDDPAGTSAARGPGR